MALVFGGAFVGGVIIASVVSDEYSDYSCYSDYSDYNDYSDYAERKRRRIEALKVDAEIAKDELTDYKEYIVNLELKSKKLKQQSAMNVSIEEMDKDVKTAIIKETEKEIEKETKELKKEIQQIDELLEKIEKIEKEYTI